MPLEHLDHVNILTGDLDRTRAFLTSVLGLEEGPRPAFGSPGHWLYRNGSALVHVSHPGRKERTHVADQSRDDLARGIVDHVAFRCSGYSETMAKLRELGIASHEADIPGGDHQVFIDGPDAVAFELIFPAAEVTAAHAR